MTIETSPVSSCDTAAQNASPALTPKAAETGAADGIKYTLDLSASASRKGGSLTFAEKRLVLRAAEFGEEAGNLIWHKREVGFCSIPRVLPLICTLIRHLTSGADAARIYFHLWSHQYEDGFVEIHDEEEFAMACDYPEAHRGVRYWRVGMRELDRLGFIKVRPMNRRKYGYVLLLHPHDVVQKIFANPKNNAPPWWRGLYERQLIRIGAKRRVQVASEAASVES